MSEREIELGQRLDDIWSSYTLNHKRIERLIQMGALFRSAEGWENYWEYVDESLRAVIVLLHASFEDALRVIVRLRLGVCTAEVLDTIPLAGISSSGQQRKFSLGKLSKHRGKTVDQVIQESVDEFLDKTSFSSCDDIAGILERKLKLDISSLREHFPILNQMISRRHKIVHTADREGAPGNLSLTPVDGEDVLRWMTTAALLVADVLSLAFPDMKVAQETRQKLSGLLDKPPAA